MWEELTPNELNEKMESALYELRKQWTDEDAELAFDEDVELVPFQDEGLNETLW